MPEVESQIYDLDDPKLVSVIDEVPLWSAPFGMRLLEVLELKPGINALDIGCGLGFPLTEIAMRLGDSSKVYGIDPWTAALERAKLKLDVYGLNNVEIINGVAEQLPFDDEFFSLIVSNNGINNVADIRKTLAECYRVSKSDSQFVMTMNLRETMIEFYDIFEDLLKERGMLTEVEKMKEQIYSKRKPLDEMISLIKESGFTVKDILHDSFNINFMDGTAMFNHFLIKTGFMEAWKSILKESEVKNIFSALEHKLNRHAESKGQLNLSVPFVTIDCRKDKGNV